MKKPFATLLLLTLILGFLWIYRVMIAIALFPCEGFGCIGSGILYYIIFIGVAALGYLIALFYSYKTTKSFIKSFSYTLLAIGVLMGIIVTDGIIEKKQMRDTMEDAYSECMETFSGKTRELAYCETYRTSQTGSIMWNSGIVNNTGTIFSGDLRGIEWGVQTQLSNSRIKIDKEKYSIDSALGERKNGVTSPLLWDSLLSAISLSEFDKLPEYPATFCPSCADSPEEFLTLSYNTGSKTVKYHETFDTIPALEPLRKVLKDFYNSGALQNQNEIQGVEMSMNGGLSCPNCVDTIKIHPNFIEYDKVTTTLDNNRDTRPPAPIHFSGSLSEDDWKSIIGGLRDEDFQELDTNLPPPDWEGMWLVIEKVGLQKRYIINDGINLGPKLTELFRKIEELKKNIRDKNTSSFSASQASPESGEIQKISINVSGMFGYTQVDIASGSLEISSMRNGVSKSGALSESDWKKVKESVNIQEFLSLDQKDPRFKCDACAYDGDNMKSITLTYSQIEKTISYGSKNDIKEFKNLDSEVNKLVETLVGKK